MELVLYQSFSLCYSYKIVSCSVCFLLLKAVWFDMLQSDIFTCEAAHFCLQKNLYFGMGCNAEVNYGYTILL